MWFFNKKEKPETEKSGEGWFEKLKSGLGKSSDKITDSITGIFTKGKLDKDTLAALEDALVMADLGPALAQRLVEKLGRERFDKDISADEVRAALAADIADILAPAERPLDTGTARPFVILVAGVNGAGKTTTMGKIAQQMTAEGKKVILAAGDTFRAAAVAQLKTWAERSGSGFVSKDEGADAAALAYEALEKATAENADVLMIDTAGRLQNKTNLMEELAKIVRVLKKKNPDAPHATLLVLDATTGQNAHSQLEIFSQMIPITGLVVTKLDGTAKGGVVVSLVERFGLPVHAIGIGEGVGDLRPFSAAGYAAALMGLERIADRTQNTIAS